MSFQTWIQRVQAIAIARNLVLQTTYASGPQGQAWVSFNWRARNGSRYGTAGAGAEFISLTTPEQYTWDWYAGPDPSPLTPPPPLHPVVDPVPALPWQRHGRYVPRVPAMAVSDALIGLFRIGQ